MNKFRQEQKIDPPASVRKKSEEDIEIHVMPRDFFGKKTEDAVRTKNTISPPPQAMPAPPVKKVPKQPLVKPKKASSWRSTRLLIIFGILLIAILAIVAFVVTRSSEAEPIEDDSEEETEEIVDNDLEEEEEIVEDPIDILYPGQDTDSDGLTDREESLYGTDFRNPDTDADTFLDGNEVFHRYDPLGLAPSTLLQAGFVQEYQGDNWVLTYPTKWTATETTDFIEFKSQDSTTIDFYQYLDSAEESFEEWHLERFDEPFNAENMQVVTTKEGYSGFMASDELNMYISIGEDMYLFFYQAHEEVTINYLQTFQMMVNSLMVEYEN